MSDPTVEELAAVERFRKAGYPSYTVEILRRNRGAMTSDAERRAEQAGQAGDEQTHKAFTQLSEALKAHPRTNNDAAQMTDNKGEKL